MNPDTREGELLTLLKPCPEDFLEIYRAHNAVGIPRNDTPQYIVKVEEDLLT